MLKRLVFHIIIVFSLYSCSSSKNRSIISDVSTDANQNKIEIVPVQIKPSDGFTAVISNQQQSLVSDTTFVNLNDYSTDFVYDMKYATSENFLKAKLYECGSCFLRYKTVKALLKANEKFMKKGFRIKLFDCYRPFDIQKKMWDIVSNPDYVADPKKGSIHNRGGAVDITLVDTLGNEIDMGTPFDYFGIEASHNYDGLPQVVQKNRKMLRSIMIQSDFRIFESEWWHYNLKNSRKDNLSNFKWKCD